MENPAAAARRAKELEEDTVTKKKARLPANVPQVQEAVQERLRQVPMWNCGYCGAAVPVNEPHPMCTEVLGLIERDDLYNNAKVLISSAWNPVLLQEPAFNLLLFLFAAPGYGKTVAGQLIVRKYANENRGSARGCAYPIYLDFSNGDASGLRNNGDALRLVALALIARFFFGLDGNRLRLVPPFTSIFSDLTIPMALTVIAKHLESRFQAQHKQPPEMNLLLVHLDEYQRLEAEIRKEILRELWSWNYQRVDTSSASQCKLRLLPIVTGLYSALLGEVWLSGSWGRHNLYNLGATPLSMSGANELVFRNLWVGLPERSQLVSDWQQALRPHIASARVMPRLLQILATTLSKLPRDQWAVATNLSGALSAFLIELDPHYKPTEWYNTLGRRAGVLAYLLLAMRGGIVTEASSSLLYSRTVPGDDEPTPPSRSLAELEHLGCLFRVEDACALPYAIICRANAANPKLNLPSDVFSPLGETTTWQSFEQIAPWLVYVLLRGYYVRGKDHILVSDLWRGAYGHCDLLKQELEVPARYNVHKEVDNWIRKRSPLVKQGQLFANLSDLRVNNVLRDLGAYICCGTNNFRIDARYSLRDACGGTVLVLEQSKHSLSDVDVATKTITTWYSEAKAMMAKTLPLLTAKPSRVIYVYFSNRRLSDPAVLNVKLEEDGYKDLLVIVHSNICCHVSDVFSFLVGVDSSSDGKLPPMTGTQSATSAPVNMDVQSSPPAAVVHSQAVNSTLGKKKAAANQASSPAPAKRAEQLRALPEAALHAILRDRKRSTVGSIDQLVMRILQSD